MSAMRVRMLGMQPDEHRYYVDYDTLSTGCARRFIHSPELLERIPASVDRKHHHGCFMQLRRVHAPFLTGNLVCVNMEAAVRGAAVELRLFSDRPQRAHLLCLYRGEPLLLYRLSVRGRSGGARGHSQVQLRVRYFRCPRFLARLTRPVLLFLGVFARLAVDTDNSIRMRRDPNLIVYRTMLGVQEP